MQYVRGERIGKQKYTCGVQIIGEMQTVQYVVVDMV